MVSVGYNGNQFVWRSPQDEQLVQTAIVINLKYYLCKVTGEKMIIFATKIIRPHRSTT